MKVKEGYVYTHTTLGQCFVLSILQEHGGNKMVVAYTDKKGLCAIEYYAFNKRVQMRLLCLAVNIGAKNKPSLQILWLLRNQVSRIL